MTPEEKEQVIMAKLEGKQIQACLLGTDVWIDIETPQWDFHIKDYRVKPECETRPYKSAEEFLVDQAIHGPYLKRIGVDGCYIMPINPFRAGAGFTEREWSYEEIAEHFTWQDGTPCLINNAEQ